MKQKINIMTVVLCMTALIVGCGNETEKSRRDIKDTEAAITSEATQSVENTIKPTNTVAPTEELIDKNSICGVWERCDDGSIIKYNPDGTLEYGSKGFTPIGTWKEIGGCLFIIEGPGMVKTLIFDKERIEEIIEMKKGDDYAYDSFYGYDVYWHNDSKLYMCDQEYKKIESFEDIKKNEVEATELSLDSLVGEWYINKENEIHTSIIEKNGNDFKWVLTSGGSETMTFKVVGEYFVGISDDDFETYTYTINEKAKEYSIHDGAYVWWDDNTLYFNKDKVWLKGKPKFFMPDIVSLELTYSEAKEYLTKLSPDFEIECIESDVHTGDRWDVVISQSIEAGESVPYNQKITLVYATSRYKGTINREDTVIRKEPSSVSEKIKDVDGDEIKLSKGTVISVIGQQADTDFDIWYLCRVKIGENMYEGYIFSGIIECSELTGDSSDFIEY